LQIKTLHRSQALLQESFLLLDQQEKEQPASYENNIKI
jgi:hypothetical protein